MHNPNASPRLLIAICGFLAFLFSAWGCAGSAPRVEFLNSTGATVRVVYIPNQYREYFGKQKISDHAYVLDLKPQSAVVPSGSTAKTIRNPIGNQFVSGVVVLVKPLQGKGELLARVGTSESVQLIVSEHDGQLTLSRVDKSMGRDPDLRMLYDLDRVLTPDQVEAIKRASR